MTQRFDLAAVWRASGAAILILWTSSLFLAVFQSCLGEVPPIKGLDILSMGYAGLFVGNPAWFANPFILVSGVMLLAGWGAGGVAVGLGVIAGALASTAFFLKVLPHGEASTLPICYHESGYWCWVTAACLAMFAPILRSRVEQDTRAGGAHDRQ